MHVIDQAAAMLDGDLGHAGEMIRRRARSNSGEFAFGERGTCFHAGN
jgi:hypothetical protein